MNDKQESARRISYEWAVEHVDEDGDIQDIEHAEALTEALVQTKPTDGCVQVDIALTKKIWSHVEGEIERLYFYPRGEADSDFTPPAKYLAEAKRFGLIA